MMNSRSMERNTERFRAWREMLEMQRNRELGIIVWGIRNYVRVNYIS